MFAHADVHEIQVLDQHLALRALPAALHAHDHVFAHVSAWHMGGDTGA